MATQKFEDQQVPGVKKALNAAEEAAASAKISSEKAEEATRLADEAVGTAQEAITRIEEATTAAETATEAANTAAESVNGIKDKVEGMLDIKSIDGETLELSEEGQLKAKSKGEVTLEQLDDVKFNGIVLRDLGTPIDQVMNIDDEYTTIEAEVVSFNFSGTNSPEMQPGAKYRMDMNENQLKQNDQFRYLDGWEVTYKGGDYQDASSYDYEPIPFDLVRDLPYNMGRGITLVEGTGPAELIWNTSVDLHAESKPTAQVKYPYGTIARISSTDPLQVTVETTTLPNKSKVFDFNVFDAVDLPSKEKYDAIGHEFRWHESIRPIDFHVVQHALAPYGKYEWYPDKRPEKADGTKEHPYWSWEQVKKHMQDNADLVRTFGNKISVFNPHMDDMGMDREYYGTLGIFEPDSDFSRFTHAPTCTVGTVIVETAGDVRLPDTYNVILLPVDGQHYINLQDIPHKVSISVNSRDGSYPTDISLYGIVEEAYADITATKSAQVSGWDTSRTAKQTGFIRTPVSWCTCPACIKPIKSTDGSAQSIGLCDGSTLIVAIESWQDTSVEISNVYSYNGGKLYVDLSDVVQDGGYGDNNKTVTVNFSERRDSANGRPFNTIEILPPANWEAKLGTYTFNFNHTHPVEVHIPKIWNDTGKFTFNGNVTITEI